MSATIAVENIWGEFGDSLKRFILVRVRDEQVADDILQDVFLKIHARIESLHDEARLPAWVYRVTRNAIADHFRKPRDGQELPDDLPAPADDGGEIKRELAASLRRMIELLPEPYREPLLLDAFEGISQQEIADRLCLSLSGAKSRIQRGRAMLRELMLACCHFEFDRRGQVINYYPYVACCSSCREACKADEEQQAEPASFVPEGRVLIQEST